MEIVISTLDNPSIAESGYLCYHRADLAVGARRPHSFVYESRVPFWRRNNKNRKAFVSETASISSGIAARYAKAVFDLAKEANTLPDLEKDLDALAEVIASSEDFSDLISSPIYTRADQANAVGELARKMELSDLTSKMLGVMAEKRRLFVLPALVKAVKAMIAAEKGEVTADVTAARALTTEQSDKLAAALKASVGKDVNINLAVDESLIGGLIVHVGSSMVDTSIRSKLSKLQNSMKEVG
jgi:F-type H+-transporting ATPase subunit delta